MEKTMTQTHMFSTADDHTSVDSAILWTCEKKKHFEGVHILIVTQKSLPRISDYEGKYWT